MEWTQSIVTILGVLLTTYGIVKYQQGKTEALEKANADRWTAQEKTTLEWRVSQEKATQDWRNEQRTLSATIKEHDDYKWKKMEGRMDSIEEGMKSVGMASLAIKLIGLEDKVKYLQDWKESEGEMLVRAIDKINFRVEKLEKRP